MGLNFPIVPIYVKDADGCISLKEDFGILEIPNFISPNNDGYNVHGQFEELRIIRMSEFKFSTDMVNVSLIGKTIKIRKYGMDTI